METTEKLPKSKVPNVNVSELKKMLDSNQDFVLLDIRMPFAAKTRWIECSKRLSIPLDDLTDRHPEIPSGKKIVIIDELGKRTAIAARYLKMKGHQDVEKVMGGVDKWAKANLPLASGS